MAHKSRALFFVHIETQFLELSRLAAVLHERGDFECVFLLWNPYPDRDRDARACLAAGFECIDADGRDLCRGRMESIPEGLGTKLMRIARSVSLLHLVLAPLFPRLPSWVAYYRQLRRRSDAVLDRGKPDILVLPEDNLEYPTAVLVRAARDRGIPGVIVPFTFSNPEEVAESRWHMPEYDAGSFPNSIVAALYPRWAHEVRGRRLLRLPAPAALAAELAGIAAGRPWVVNDGDCEAIAVESPFMLRKYVEQGLPPGKLVVTGSMSDDVLHRQLADRAGLRAELLASLGLQDNRPLLLVAIPPDQYSSGRSGTEFPSYAELLRNWGEALARADAFNVVVRLHPRTTRASSAVLETEFGLRICEQDTALLVPLCDAYAACISATIRMAMACGIPVVNYDCYRYGYSDFNDVPGLLEATDRPTFEGHLATLADPESRARLARLSNEFASRMFRIDGGAAGRIRSLLREKAGLHGC